MAQPSAVTAGCKLSPRGAPTRPRSASSVRRAPYLLYATATAAMPKQTAALNARPNKIIHTPRSSGHRRGAAWALSHPRPHLGDLCPGRPQLHPLLNVCEGGGLSSVNGGQVVEYDLVNNRGKQSAENLKTR